MREEEGTVDPWQLRPELESGRLTLQSWLWLALQARGQQGFLGEAGLSERLSGRSRPSGVCFGCDSEGGM